MKFISLLAKFVGLCIAITGLYVALVYKEQTPYYYLGLSMIIIGLIMTIGGFIIEIIKPKKPPTPTDIKTHYKCPLCHETYDLKHHYCLACGYTFKEEDKE